MVFGIQSQEPQRPVRGGQRPDPEKEVQDYMRKNGCTREEAIKALEKLHGGAPKQKVNDNVDVKQPVKRADRPDPQAAYDAVKMQHPNWSDAQIKGYLNKLYGGKPEPRKGE